MEIKDFQLSEVSQILRNRSMKITKRKIEGTYSLAYHIVVQINTFQGFGKN